MNEHNLRNQVNVIYGSPQQVYAAGQDKNLVQGAEPPVRRVPRRELSEIEQLERILNATASPNDKVRFGENVKKKQISQGGLNCKKELAQLEQILSLTGEI